MKEIRLRKASQEFSQAIEQLKEKYDHSAYSKLVETAIIDYAKLLQGEQVQTLTDSKKAITIKIIIE